jgi:hypothetical protein
MRRQFDARAIRYSGKVPLTGGRAFLIANRERHRFPSSTMNLLRSSAFSLRGKISAGQILEKVLKTPPASVRGQSMEAWIRIRQCRSRIGFHLSRRKWKSEPDKVHEEIFRGGPSGSALSVGKKITPRFREWNPLSSTYSMHLRQVILPV